MTVTADIVSAHQVEVTVDSTKHKIDLRTCTDVMLGKLVMNVDKIISGADPKSVQYAAIQKRLKFLKALNDFGTSKLPLARKELLAIVAMLAANSTRLKLEGLKVEPFGGSVTWPARNTICIRPIDHGRQVVFDAAGLLSTEPTTHDVADEKKCDNGKIQLADIKELRISVNSKYVSKAIHTEDGADIWTFNELLEIATYFHESPQLRFIAEDAVFDLGCLICRPNTPSRPDLVNALLRITTRWSQICDDDEKCLKVPNQRMIKDPDFRKVLRAFADVNAKNKKLNTELKNAAPGTAPSS